MFHIVTRRIAREGNAVIGANGLRHAELLENGLKHRCSPSNYCHCRSDWFEHRKADQNQAIQMKPFPVD